MSFPEMSNYFLQYFFEKVSFSRSKYEEISQISNAHATMCKHLQKHHNKNQNVKISSNFDNIDIKKWKIAKK